jgi:hypothetical protein
MSKEKQKDDEYDPSKLKKAESRVIREGQDGKFSSKEHLNE